MERLNMADSSAAERKSFHWRGLTSFIVTLAFLVLAMTGVILYVSPQGRVANWTGWAVLRLSKEQWAAVHTTAALTFLIASGFHIYFNWSALVRYLVLKRRLHLKRELIGSAAVVAIVFAGTAAGIPPFSTVADLNDRIKAHWEGRSEQAPYPHAEASTFADFSGRTGIPVADLMERLARAGITVDDPASRTLDDIARANGLSPKELFARISGSSASGSEGHGQGLGRLTVRDLCESIGIPLERALDVLREEGYAAEGATTLKTLAAQKGSTPAEIKSLIAEKSK
jgi:hypothetical protein